MSKKIDLTGRRFGRLVVLCENGRAKNRNVMWLCRCDCGNEVTVSSDSLKRGDTQSCGCYKTKHGMHKTRLYNIWQHMLKRTGVTKGANEANKRDYIDRGITLCTEWKTFENFCDWSLGHGYADDLQIDRIDNNAGYFPANCRWLTPKENTNNRRCTLRLSDGTSLAMFCTKVGIKTCENGRPTKQYDRIRDAYRKHNKAHPELLAKANDLIALYKKTLEMLKLLEDARRLKADVQRLSQMSH